MVFTSQMWIIIGFIGQTIFASRFLIQWIVSERASKSIIPNIFWWISILGSFVLLSYAIHKEDPVFIVGQSCGFLIYARNLYLIKKGKKNKKKQSDPSDIMKL
ncbi:lipid-A-disaccharide synthase N-terminal domain-containing protein [Rickettsiales bacterium]|nr:lipid-A-disaccharide synthase N-terminal domain-containing protein [Rickettsiales bacterium]